MSGVDESTLRIHIVHNVSKLDCPRKIFRKVRIQDVIDKASRWFETIIADIKVVHEDNMDVLCVWDFYPNTARFPSDL